MTVSAAPSPQQTGTTLISCDSSRPSRLPINFITKSNKSTNLTLNLHHISRRERQTADATEKRLINEVYDFAKSIAELQLTESELALYSALVLLQPGELFA